MGAEISRTTLPHAGRGIGKRLPASSWRLRQAWPALLAIAALLQPVTLQAQGQIRFDRGIPVERTFEPISLESLIPRLPGETAAEAILRRRQQDQMPADLDRVVPSLERAAALSLDGCARDPMRCAEGRRLSAVATALKAGVESAPDCGKAAKEFLPYYESGTPPEGIAREFDLKCLGSIEPRLADGLPDPPVPLPRAFAGKAGAMSAVGILEADGTPFCGALLRNDHTLVTARHCYAATYFDLKAGKVTVRPATGQGGPWAVDVEPVAEPAESSDEVRHDWIVLRIATSDAIGASDTVLMAYPGKGDIAVLGHFAHYASARYPDSAKAAKWRRGLRYPRPNLCQAINVVDDCLKLTCQTVRGFSGTPIFIDASGSPEQPYQVVGFISQPSQTSSGCPTPKVPDLTLAVSASAIR